MPFHLSSSSFSSKVFITITIGGHTISRSVLSRSPFHFPNCSPAGTTEVPLRDSSSSSNAANSLWSFTLLEPFVLA
uniref:Uncharacterized protein n=1 Tax=Arundo donax TaxID=35708 RepID=A0A0A9DXV1_ARUDO